MDLKLKDKVVVITGAGSGIGESVAMILAQEGAKIVIGEFDMDRGVKVAEKIKEKRAEVVAFPMDVSKRDQVDILMNKAVKKFEKIDILVNSAGVCLLTPIEQVDEKEWDYLLNINLKGTFNCCQSAIKFMKKKNYGKIINVASLAAQVGGTVSSVSYAVSKAGVVCLTKSFAKYGARYGINVNAVSPGPIDSNMTKNWPISAKETLISQTPLGRLGQPRDVAAMIVFLASDLAQHITGENVFINGGFLMN